MKFFSLLSRLRIGTRIYAGFSVTLVLVAALGGLGIYSLQGVKSTLLAFSQISDGNTDIAELNALNLGLRRNAYAFAMTGDVQALADVRTSLTSLREAFTRAGAENTGDVKDRLQKIAAMVENYANNFEVGVERRTARDNENSTLTLAGLRATGSIADIVTAATSGDNFEVAALGAAPLEAMMNARLTVARFIELRDQKLVNAFNRYIAQYRDTVNKMKSKLTDPLLAELAKESVTNSEAYVRAFQSYAPMTVELEKLFFVELEGQGQQIVRALDDIV
ncbi:hypothetical protein RA307_31915, partial [Xanthobacteraceae bacterium Astr-EGSB]|uniref:hypothetical protein n=1 Tax=Astrobacterium formosum TaxID=3069710 RepID=UPI0027B308AF|nr:hypothetical protein [Xanthobacteraceae bacterium Astr-EGSB]